MKKSFDDHEIILTWFVSRPLNNTVIYGTDGYCLSGTPGIGPWTNAGCMTFRGGAYDSLASSSKNTAASNQYPYDGATDPVLGGTTYPQVTHASDNLQLNDNITITSFPLGIALSDWGEQAYTPMMGIGLGTNSTILNWLVSSGQIASRSWSYFWGRTTVSATSEQLDGSVVFGGYDRAKVTGSKYTQPMTTAEPNCPSLLVVTITNMVLNFANGSDVSLFPATGSTAITACLTPALSTLMWMPLDPFFDNMMNLTDNNIFAMGRSVGIYYWNMRYETSHFEPYDGDLTITLQSGLSVRIRNDQLVQPHTSINQTTGAIVVNNTAPDLVINSLQNVQATQLAQLGWQFFSAAYLLVNQDAHEFTLWEANPTAEEDMVAVDTTGADISTFCSASTVSSTSTAGGERNGTTTTETSSSLSAAVIAGSVAASVAAVGLVSGLLLWWILRRRSQGLQETILNSPLGLDYPINSKLATSDQAGSLAYTKTELDGQGRLSGYEGRGILHELYTTPDVDKKDHVAYGRAPVYTVTVHHELQ